MTRLTALVASAGTALRALLALLLLLAGSLAHAVPSACTALWGTQGTNLVYYNPTNNTWVTAISMGTGGNSLGGYESNGTLYFTSGTGAGTARMYKATFSNTTGVMGTSQVSATPISVPPNLTYTNTLGAQATTTASALVGATLDRDTSNRRMFLYLTSGSGAAVPNLPMRSGPNGTALAAIGVLDPEFPTVVTWSVVYETSSTGTVTYPYLGGSGDIFADQQTGALWIVSNANPVRMLKLSTTYAGFTINSAQVISTATVQVGGVGLTNSIGAVGVEPRTGFVYIADGIGNATWRITDHTTSPVVATLSAAGAGATDAGNCVAPPDPPTITKSFNPTTATTPGVTTMTIVITNPNKVPIYTTAVLTDALPASMSVYTTPGITVSCFGDGVAATRPTSTSMTGVVGATSVAIPSGAMIPGGSSGQGGSCSFSIRVSATIANFYNNTIPAGSLSTTAGSNAAQASATFQVQNLSLPNAPLISKSFNPTTSTSTVGTTTLTIVITNPNTITNTTTAALIDTLPTNMGITTPSLLSINCFSNGTSVTRPSATTATTTTTALTIPTGVPIPGGSSGGSCSFAVRVTATLANVYLNTIAAGSLTMVSGVNAAATTSAFYLRASDFNVTKSQADTVGGATTTGVLDIASGYTMQYTLQIRNSGGVAGTRTFTDTLPQTITPILSITPVAVGGAGCSLVTSTTAQRTNVVGTVTGATIGAGCNVTIVARASVTSAITTVTNTVGIYTVTGTVDTNTADNSATVVLTIKPAANLSITKTDGTLTVLTGQTVAYTITVANAAGGASADQAVVKDPVATGLSCYDPIVCTTTGGAVCPSALTLFVNSLQTNGLFIPTFPAGSTVSFVVSCTVTATGE